MSEETSRRKLLKLGGITLATGLAGCQDAGRPNSTTPDETGSNGDEDGSKEQDTPTGSNLDFTYQEFVDRAIIDPKVITSEVIREGDQELQDNYDLRRGFEVFNVANAMKQLSPENAEYLDNNMQENLPWSVFDGVLSDMQIVGEDADGTHSAILNYSLKDAEERLESNDEIDNLESRSDGVMFDGHVTPHDVERRNYLDSVFVQGYVMQTDLGLMTSITRDFASDSITRGEDDVSEIARIHEELINEGGKSIIDKEYGDIAVYVLNRAEGGMEDQELGPASDRVNLDLSPYLSPAVGRSSHRFYDKDGYNHLVFDITESGSGYTPQKDEDASGHKPIEKHANLAE